MAWGATCVQRLDGSRDSAIHTKYRISLRSSSMREPRYPLPRVVLNFRKKGVTRRSARTPRTGRQLPTCSFFVIWFLGAIHAGGSLFGHGRRDRASHPPRRRNEATVAHARALRGGSGHEGVLAPPRCLDNAFAGRSARQVSTMILPQVHLRKPCYDFSFL